MKQGFLRALSVYVCDNMEYREEDFLPLSGLQHFKFCRRQWALIHIEAQWAENYRTIDGEIMHKNAHNDAFNEKRGEIYITRSMRVFSASLGVTGSCDIVEFKKCTNGITLNGKDGLWQPFPIEYKRGSPKEHTADALQLCAQAMCLEEMLCCRIDKGAIFYGEIRHRHEIEIDFSLRSEVRELSSEMHELYNRGYTPKVKTGKFCNACSLKDICMPELMKKKSVDEYLRKAMEVT